MKPDYISKPDWEILTKKYPNTEDLLEKLTTYPPQYLIGDVEFCGKTIKVDERVLIPRFETENLVDKTIKYAKELFNKKINIIDLGTGSGCIAIALKTSLYSDVAAIDISKEALTLAKENARLNNADITFINKSMTDTLDKTYDIIISNPPYIPYDGFVEEKVKNAEPNIALFADNDGLYFYEQILTKHLSNLNIPGLMAFEIGDNQKEKLETFVTNLNLHYKFEEDFQGLPRYLFIFKL